MDRRLFLIFVVAQLSAGAWASNVYRCDDGGRLRFSDRPCVAGQEPLAIATPNTMETSAGDASLARDYDDDIARRRKSQVASAKPTEGTASESEPLKKKEPRKRKSRSKSGKGKAKPSAPSRDRAPAHIVQRRK
jgi:hypothetical protein